MRLALQDNVVDLLGRDPASATSRDWFYALAYFLRGRLSEARIQHWRDSFAHKSKWTYYLSMEFLPGKLLRTCLSSQGLLDVCREALADAGVDLEALFEIEVEPALGNGGLGRLAACLLESMASLNYAGLGYCIRYEYGMFRQEIENGEQVEHPENWLKEINPWEFARPDFTYRVPFNGHVSQVTNRKGDLEVHWSGTDNVSAMAYDMPVIGANAVTTGMVRLWSAKATSDFNLAWFNRGGYVEAVEEKVQSETISRVLYPNDATNTGRELRLKQEYFLVSASIQDILHRHLRQGIPIDKLADHVAIQLNDTHPVLAIVELMRLLVDVHGLGWETAWDTTVATFGFTNHTLLWEAIESWPVPLFERLLPRHLQIIYEINARFLRDVMHRNPGDTDLLRRVSLIDEDGLKSIRMAFLAVVGSHRVNGVSQIHTSIMRDTLFRDFDHLFPDRIVALTNGISFRRWITDTNPRLKALIDRNIGGSWMSDFARLRNLERCVSDAAFIDEFVEIKRANKRDLANTLKSRWNFDVDPASMFDMHIKRIHEYKRQLLNILQVIGRYNRIRAGIEHAPRTVIFSGKAAPGYAMAKRIIHLIHCVADIVNHDPRARDLLKIVFVPNYGVQIAEILVSAGDLSEQISLAGTEASGTGNMKLALNGALSIMTEDGANLEIRDAVGSENIWTFGNRFEDLQKIRANGYAPRAIYNSNAEIKQSLDMIADGYFSLHERALFEPVVQSLLDGGDPFMILADYADYIRAQAEIDAAWADQTGWTKKAVLNVSRMGHFSMDRLFQQYAQQVWNVKPVPLPA